MKKVKGKEQLGYNISYPQVRQQWFAIGIFPLKLLFGLTGNRPQSAPACSFLRYRQYLSPLETQSVFEKAFNLRVLAA